jgi:valyl-tRNA synthetase
MSQPEPSNLTASSGLPKAYTPAAFEEAVTARWDAAKAFAARPERVVNGEAKPYCIVIPPPNVTAALHLGHALNNTLQDILIRAHRMMGFETLWMPGTDHAGIATQAVVEKRVMKEEGKRRTDFPRDVFVAKIQAFKDEYEKTITAQLKAMGCSCDWDRQRFTMDEQCAAAVREAFFRLFRDGLIYRGKRLVNWDPVLQTAVADDEVEDIEVDGNFYYLRYPLVGHGQQPISWSELSLRGYPGAERHPPESPAWITVATTRPETYLGDTAVAVNPRDPRAKSLRGLSVRLPIVGRVIPIIEDEYVVLPKAYARSDEEAADPKAEFATGFLKVTPAHDPNDYELGQRHKLPMINVMAPDASISDKHGWSSPDELHSAHIFVGKTREEARKLVVREFKAHPIGNEPALEGIKPYRHSVKHSDRSKAAIEYYLSDQWFCKVTDERLAPAANAALVPDQRSLLRKQEVGGEGGRSAAAVGAVRDGGPMPRASARGSGDASLRFYPARYAKTYETWHDNIRDWCISRQLWWGHRIPVWTCRVQLTGDNWQDAIEPWGIPDNLFEGGDNAGFAVGWIMHVASGRRWCDPYSTNGDVPGDETKFTEFVYENPGEYEIQVCCIDEAWMEERLHDSRPGLMRDPDVLDTWFSSALWPLSTMGWPNPEGFNAASNRDLLGAFNPSSVLCTAREIITLWVSRMVMFNRYFLGAAGPGSAGRSGQVPFHDVFIHAMIQDGEGRKMSKSLGNGVDPRDIIASHGCDAMRFTLAQMTTQTQDVRMPVVRDPKTGVNTSPKFDNGRNFVNKLWNAARFALATLEKPLVAGEGAGGGAGGARLVDRWMLSRLAQTTRQIEGALAGYEFSDYAESVYKLLWWDFCDWYLEAIKGTVESSASQRAVLRATLDGILRLLHPIAPFVTEAIHEHLRAVKTEAVAGLELSAGDGLLCRASWPKASASLVDAEAEREFEFLRGLITAVREVRAQHQVPPKRRITLHAPAALASRCAAAPGLVDQLAGLEAIVTTAPGPGGGKPVPVRYEGHELVLSNLADAIDAGAERERLTRQIAELEKAESTLDKRLSSPGYAQKAPAKLVEDSKAQLERTRAELVALRAQLAGLGPG